MAQALCLREGDLWESPVRGLPEAAPRRSGHGPGGPLARSLPRCLPPFVVLRFFLIPPSPRAWRPSTNYKFYHASVTRQSDSSLIRGPDSLYLSLAN